MELGRSHKPPLALGPPTACAAGPGAAAGVRRTWGERVPAAPARVPYVDRCASCVHLPWGHRSHSGFTDTYQDAPGWRAVQGGEGAWHLQVSIVWIV